MIRGLILVLALAGPAMAEQPTDQLVAVCGRQAFEGVYNNKALRPRIETLKKG